MRATTFGLDGEQVEVEILSVPSSTGIVKVTDGKRTFARHRDRLTPLDDDARAALGDK